jgi:quaternary ammonium compound-resistance protein SugE
MGWIFLLIASILEIGWIISLKYTEGFTKIIPIIFYAAFGGGSAYFLSLSLKSIPMATAYSIWMGIAIIGATIFGIVFLKEPVKILRLFFMLMILIGIIGMKISTQNS